MRGKNDMKKNLALLVAVLILLTGCGSSKEQFSNERAYRPAINLDNAVLYDDDFDLPVATASEPNYKLLQLVSDAYFYINDVRAAQNLEPFEWDVKLADAADIRAEEASVYFDNLIRPNGDIWETIAPYDALAENIYKTKKSETSAIKLWMDNKIDKENFYSDEFNKIGISVFLNSKGEYTWAALFGADSIDVTFAANFEFDEASIFKDTENNRKKTKDDLAMLYIGLKSQRYNLRIPKSDDNKYLLRMIDDNNILYEADIPNLESGWNIKMNQAKDGDNMTLKISDEKNEVIDEYEVVATML
jgi:uncharacterized protein YkwD